MYHINFVRVKPRPYWKAVVGYSIIGSLLSGLIGFCVHDLGVAIAGMMFGSILAVAGLLFFAIHLIYDWKDSKP